MTLVRSLRAVSTAYLAQADGDMGTAFSDREVAERIDEIRNDQVHGATYLAREAVRVLARAAEARASDGGYIPDLDEVSRRLGRAKPAMGAIGNVARRFVEELGRSGEGCDPHTLVGQLLDRMEEASSEAARRAAGFVFEGARVLTCSHSSAVVGTFKTAKASGGRFSVAALESRTGGLSYGERLLEEVSALGIAAILVSDAAVSKGVGKADMVMVGADKLLSDGAIVNGWPTLKLGLATRGSNPFYVVCESFKLDPDPRTEEGFDFVPASLITRVITENTALI